MAGSGASPESIITKLVYCTVLHLHRLWLWIPGSSLRSDPE